MQVLMPQLVVDWGVSDGVLMTTNTGAIMLPTPVRTWLSGNKPPEKGGGGLEAKNKFVYLSLKFQAPSDVNGFHCSAAENVSEVGDWVAGRVGGGWPGLQMSAPLSSSNGLDGVMPSSKAKYLGHQTHLTKLTGQQTQECR